MIKIDTSLFEQDIIRSIYQNEGIVVKLLQNEISNYLIRPNNNEIVKKLLVKWFCDEHEVLSNEKISQFLLSTDLTPIINDYFETICDYYWGNKEYSSVLIKWPSIKKEALETNNKSIRKDKITQVINADSICMFEGINVTDLDAEPRNGSVFANKKKIERIVTKYGAELDKIRSEFSNIFDYDTFAPKFRHKLLEAMHISVCPYCNRQYITIFVDNNEREVKSTADIDHFYGKANYPFLALSLYNFVPSCPICNSRFKLQRDFFLVPHVNPYKRGFETDGIFRLSNLDALLGNTSSSEPIFELVSPTHNQEVENSIQTFHLSAVYQSHADYVKELIIKAKVYSDKQLEEYLHNFKDLFNDKKEMKNILYGTYLQSADSGKRPLAKLALDILIDLGVDLE